VLISTAYAQTAPAAAGGSGGMESMMSSMLPILLMFAVLYFLMIRPQMKRQKEQKTMIDALTVGDELVTVGGVLGKIRRLSESYLHIEVSSGVELQIERSAVMRVLPKGTMK
jgi:preprotein translocase subunit YajC